MSLLTRIKRLAEHIRMYLSDIMIIATTVISAYALLFTDTPIGRVLGFEVIGIICTFVLLFIG